MRRMFSIQKEMKNMLTDAVDFRTEWLCGNLLPVALKSFYDDLIKDKDGWEMRQR